MKLKFALAGAMIILTGCAGSYPEKIVAKGPLICEANEVCPELAMRWNDETRDGFKITAEISNSEPYEIKQFVFLVDQQQPYIYSTIQSTQYLKQSESTVSSNSIRVPVSFLNSFRDARAIELKLVTDKGDIVRPIVKADGQKSSAYLTFMKGYVSQPAQ
ncbi:hypothetical protein [Acinetobacter sp. WZC-1]|uniref:hypothetical protein n=1 Tax=Acinetobacter sp. WZC-1 TaxID=3459034 RepID=UPI00403E25E6